MNYGVDLHLGVAIGHIILGWDKNILEFSLTRTKSTYEKVRLVNPLTIQTYIIPC